MGKISLRGERKRVELHGYSTTYTGEQTPEAIYSLQLLAARLGAEFDSGRITRLQKLDTDILDRVQKEVEDGKLLVALGDSSVLPGVVNYMEQGGYENVSQSSIDRLVLLAKTSQDVLRWSPQLPVEPKREPFPLTVTTFFQGEKEYTAVFAPVSIEEADRILLYVGRDTALYDYTSYVSVPSLPSVKNLETMFPVKIEERFGAYIVSSEQMSEAALKELIDYSRVSFTFNNIDDLTGTFISYLLAESLGFRFRLRWLNRRLELYDVGYLQAEEISKLFVDLLTKVPQVRYVPLNSYEEAVALSGVKCFPHLGVYYAADSGKQGESVERTPVKQIEDPLERLFREDVRPFLSSLGYDATKDSTSVKSGVESQRWQNIVASYPGFTPEISSLEGMRG